MRLAKWPRLSTLPTTALIVVAVIGLDYLTFLAWFIGKPGPDGWLLFLTGLHAGGITQFGIKRKTHIPDNGTSGAPGA
jgi:hypothetical protein